MKVLVTGAAGFIGSTLSHKLLDRGDEVIGLDNLNDLFTGRLDAFACRNGDLLDWGAVAYIVCVKEQNEIDEFPRSNHLNSKPK